MKNMFKILFFVFLLSVSLMAQVDTVLVPTDNPTVGGNLNKAVQTAISNGTLNNTVFKLQLYGYYILTGIITTPAHSQLTIVGPDPGNTQQTALPELVLGSGGVNWVHYFDIYGDITLKNVWLLYADVTGVQQGATITIEDDSLANKSGKGEVGIFDDVIFDYSTVPQSSGGSITLQCQDFKGTFNNCYFRNDVSPSLQYYGRSVSWGYQTTSWHTDSISFVNCTFANMGYGYEQEKPEYADHVWFNHCTFLNIMMFPMESGYWHWLSVTNSIFVNTYMMGDVPAQRGGNGLNPNGGTVNIDTLTVTAIGFVPPFKEADRHIVFANSSYYLEKWLRDFYANNPYGDTASQNQKPIAQPMMSKKTIGFFNNKSMWPHISKANLYDNADPRFNLPPTNQDSIKSFILARYVSGANVDWAYKPQNDINGIWPLPEDLAYSNDTLKTAGMGGFPLGDLYHWWPNQYVQWKAQETQENQTINDWLTNTITAVKTEPANVPSKFVLNQNYPNPFNPSTRINYSLAKSGFVTLAVYNILGQKVATLFSGNQKAGNHSVNFNASKLASGVYLYRLESNGLSLTRKMVLMK